eukprot:IDg16153t1
MLVQHLSDAFVPLLSYFRQDLSPLMMEFVSIFSMLDKSIAESIFIRGECKEFTISEMMPYVTRRLRKTITSTDTETLRTAKTILRATAVDSVKDSVVIPNSGFSVPVIWLGFLEHL